MSAWLVRASGVYLRVVHGEHRTTVAGGIVNESYARLIAAAPALLEALESIIADINAGHVGSDGWYCEPVHKDDVAKARAAISLAKGETA